MTCMSKPPMFSRTSIGRNRWFWVVLEEWGCDPIAKGIARSPEDARAEAERQYGTVSQQHATLAKVHWDKQRAMARQRTVAKGDDAQPLEFAYRCYLDHHEYDGSEYEVIERHRISRKPRSGSMWRTISMITVVHYQVNGGITIDRPSCLIAGSSR